MQGRIQDFKRGGGWQTRHLGNYPQDPGNEVAIKPEHRLSTWVGKRERFPTNFAIMSQSESYFASLGVDYEAPFMFGQSKIEQAIQWTSENVRQTPVRV